jgi:hypothetical protein
MYGNPAFIIMLPIWWLLSLAPAVSASAPAQLRGKSIVVSWTEDRIQRVVGEANFRAVAANHQFDMYISSAGRMFSKMTNTTRRGSGSAEQVGGAPGANRQPVFANQSMTVFMPNRNGSGIRRLSVQFDGSYAGCTANVVRAKAEGAKTMVTTSLIIDGKIEIQSVTVSAASCRLQNGNVFGGE